MQGLHLVFLLALNFRQGTHELFIAATQCCHIRLQQLNLTLQIKQAFTQASQFSGRSLTDLTRLFCIAPHDFHALTQFQNSPARFIIFEQSRMQATH
ncbi:hypothetical protein [Rhodoferax sp.]|uniref:hypothetical protein n=1 Tax=Rhodoferax sp. TaxID=50421 RepID=UPI00344CE485